MKKITIIFIAVVSIGMSMAQDLMVESFCRLDNDLTASTDGTMVLDQNGEKCALIKVVTSLCGFTFDVGEAGVVRTVKHSGEIWLYVPASAKHLSILHDEMGSIRDFVMSLQKGSTYVLVLRKLDDLKTTSNAVEEQNVAVSAAINVKCKDVESSSLTFNVNGVSFLMVYVAGGTFMMGATDEQGKSADKDEMPVHEVTLPSYYIGETEVTQELWEAVMSSNPSKYKGPQNPVEEVSWLDCQEFISKLNTITGKKFRLPTESEWEFAARGGNHSKGYKYSGRNSASCGNGDESIRSVKVMAPNELGVYDMSGNVWEWCSDRYGKYMNSQQDGKFRVNRGGSYGGNVSGCRVSDRGYNNPSIRSSCIGLRIVL